MFTITPAEFAKLSEARHLQVERYRTAYFKREGALPSDTDPAINPQWLRVKLGELDKCIPVGILSKWANTFPETHALGIELNGRVTIERETRAVNGKTSTGQALASRLSLLTHSIVFDDKEAAYMGSLPNYRHQAAPLDSPVELTPTPGGSLLVSVPDQSAELATLRKETTATRKRLTQERALEKGRKAERNAREQLKQENERAAEAQALIDGMTFKQAITYARKCLSAARSHRAALVEPFPLPAWFPPTFEVSLYEWNEAKQEHGERLETRDTGEAWRGLVAAYQATLDTLAAYKPRLNWPSYVASLASKAGMSLAAYKRANPDRAFKTYGPTFDKLKEAKRAAFRSLESFLESRCTAYLTANHHRAYTRARQLLSTWPQRCADLQSQIREAIQAQNAITEGTGWQYWQKDSAGSWIHEADLDKIAKAKALGAVAFSCREQAA